MNVALPPWPPSSWFVLPGCSWPFDSLCRKRKTDTIIHFQFVTLPTLFPGHIMKHKGAGGIIWTQERRSGKYAFIWPSTLLQKLNVYSSVYKKILFDSVLYQLNSIPHKYTVLLRLVLILSSFLHYCLTDISSLEASEQKLVCISNLSSCMLHVPPIVWPSATPNLSSTNYNGTTPNPLLIRWKLKSPVFF